MGARRLEVVFEASYRRLVGQLYAVCGDLAEAEDVVAEAFVKAAGRERQFDRTDNPEAWLRTVAVNLARTRHRRRLLGGRILHRVYARDPVHPELGTDRLVLMRAMRSLPPHHREAIALHYSSTCPSAR